MAPRRRNASPAQPATTSFAVDSVVGYDQDDPRTGKLERVAVRLKHIDRTLDPPAYTIELPSGVERQTERHRLHVLRPQDEVAASYSGGHFADLARRQRFEQHLRARPPPRRYSRVLTMLIALAMLAATAPSEASLALYLTTRRDSSTLGQMRHSVQGLWNSLRGLASPESERITEFASFGVLSVASVADGRSFLGACGVWLEAPTSKALGLHLPSILELARRIGQDGLASWSPHAANDLYAIAAANAAIMGLWNVKRQSWWWQDLMRRNFTVSRRNLRHRRYHTLITAVFSHEDVYHLAHNMLWLLAVGPEIQAQLGREQTLLLYLLGGICGALLSALVHPAHVEGIGASGSVYALEACNCLLQPHRLYVWAGMQVTSMQLLGSRLCLDLISHFQGSRVDYASHLGGAATGVAYWWLYLSVDPWMWT